MVVYRKEQTSCDPLTGTTAAQLVEETTNEAGKSATSVSHMVPRAILTSRPNSHPFQERHLSLDQAVKVGRSVARCRPATNNAIFDCKVLSRNHALLWYENGKFYLQDTKSSNGTFVNNQRLSKGSEESPAREVCSGDIVQFGVDVVENSRKVVHGCVVATLKLYLPDGKEAKASPTTTVVPSSPETAISSQELYQLSHYLQEALHREQRLESKLKALEIFVSNTQDESDIGWKALIEEDRLLSRIEFLESQLHTCGKNVTEEKLKDDVLKLQEDKDKYQIAAKESLKKVLQEKLEAIRKVQDLENSLSNTENECSHLGELNKQKEQEIEALLEKNTDFEKEITDLTKKLQELEEKYQDLISQTNEDKLALENNAEELRKEEQKLSTKIELLQAENEFAKEQLSAMKAHFDILKKNQDNEENIERNGNLSPHDDINTTQCDTAEKNLIQELSCEVNRLELELQRVQKENLKNESLHADGSGDCTSNGEAKPGNYVNKLQADILQLKKLLNESIDDKKLVEGELIQVRGQLEEVQNNAKKAAAELHIVQEQLNAARQDSEEKSHKLVILEMKLSILEGGDGSERKGHEHLENEYVQYKLKSEMLKTELSRFVAENSKLKTQLQGLKESTSETDSSRLTFGNLMDSMKPELNALEKKLMDAQEEIVLVKERYDECNREKSYLQVELAAFKEQLQLLSVQSKTVSVCSIIPLMILAIAVLLAFYPTLEHLTATSDQV